MNSEWLNQIQLPQSNKHYATLLKGGGNKITSVSFNMRGWVFESPERNYKSVFLSQSRNAFLPHSVGKISNLYTLNFQEHTLSRHLVESFDMNFRWVQSNQKVCLSMCVYVILTYSVQFCNIESSVGWASEGPSANAHSLYLQRKHKARWQEDRAKNQLGNSPQCHPEWFQG